MVSAKVLNVKDFARQTLPWSGREARPARPRARLGRLLEVGSRLLGDRYSKMHDFRSGPSGWLTTFRELFLGNLN